MRQTIHIFAKDARHWRWPVVALMALLVARSMIAPRYTPFYPAGWGLNHTIDILDMLLPVVWWFLSAALIHDESLVGDRQFWLTSPYSRRSLMAAKALFLLTFMMVPVMVSDAVILSAEGFSPWDLMRRLLWFELLKAAILAPAVILASITGGMRQFLLACLLVVIVVAVMVQFPGPAVYRPVVPWGLALILVVPWQYARRRTTLVRWMVAATVLWGVIPLDSSRGSFPEVGVVPPPDVGVRFDPGRQRLDWHSASGARDGVEVDLPIELRGRDRELVNGTVADLRIENRGQVWHPRWDWRTNLAGRADSDWLEISLRESEYSRFKADPVTVRAVFGLWVYERQGTVPIRVGRGWQPMEGVGYLRFDNVAGRVEGVRRMPLAYAEQNLVFTIPAVLPSGERELLRGTSGGVFPGNGFEPHMTPVLIFAAQFEGGHNQFDRLATDTVTVEVLRPVALVRRTLTIEGVRLADWLVAP